MEEIKQYFERSVAQNWLLKPICGVLRILAAGDFTSRADGTKITLGGKFTFNVIVPAGVNATLDLYEPTDAAMVSPSSYLRTNFDNSAGASTVYFQFEIEGIFDKAVIGGAGATVTGYFIGYGCLINWE